MTLISPNKGYPLEKLEGDSGTMSQWHDTFTRVGDELSELSDTTEGVKDISGNGKSITAARQDASDLVTALTPSIEEADLLAGVMQHYSDAFETHATRANAMIEDIEDAHTRWQQLSQQAQEAGREALSAAMNEDQDDAATEAALQASDEACAARDEAKKELDSLWQEYEGYYSQWDEAYDQALADLATAAGDLPPAARDLLKDLLAADSPEEVSELWDDASPAERKALQNSRPEIIGNLDGVPYDVRAKTNESHLKDLLASDDLDAETRKQLEAIAGELKSGSPPPNLISFDPDGSEQVTAALAYNDLDSAEKINVLVPGMKSNVEGMGPWGTTAQQINDEVTDSATVVWFGYDSPNATEETGMGRAEDGAAALGGFLDGIDTLSPAATTSVVAHSYGTTTAAQAIGSEPGGHGVDNFITVGSAGLPNDEQVQKNLENGPQIYATTSPDDHVAWVGRNATVSHRTSPSDIPGTVVFGSDGGVDASGDPLALTRGHGAHSGESGILPWDNGRDSGYLHDGTESFYNVKHILETGSPGTQMDGPGSQDGGWRSVQREASDFADWVGGGVSDAAGWTYDKASDTSDWTVDKVTSFGSWVSDKLP